MVKMKAVTYHIQVTSTMGVGLILPNSKFGSGVKWEKHFPLDLQAQIGPLHLKTEGQVLLLRDGSVVEDAEDIVFRSHAPNMMGKGDLLVTSTTTNCSIRLKCGDISSQLSDIDPHDVKHLGRYHVVLRDGTAYFLSVYDELYVLRDVVHISTHDDDIYTVNTDKSISMWSVVDGTHMNTRPCDLELVYFQSLYAANVNDNQCGVGVTIDGNLVGVRFSGRCESLLPAQLQYCRVKEVCVSIFDTVEAICMDSDMCYYFNLNLSSNEHKIIEGVLSLDHLDKVVYPQTKRIKSAVS